METVRLDPVEQVLDAVTGQPPHFDEGRTAAIARGEFKEALADAKGRFDLVARQQPLKIQGLGRGVILVSSGREIWGSVHRSLA